MSSRKEHFLIDPQVIYLNHASFGATPRPVFEVYQEWQRRIENQPVQFFISELIGHLEWARVELSKIVHSPPENLVFIPNATTAVNLIARSLPFEPGDEILASDHEYGACDIIWNFISEKKGTKYIRRSISLPMISKEEVLEGFWDGVTNRTRLIFLSHITSQTAILLPVEDICKRAREAGILTFIDGAHTLGQITLDLERIDADFYTSNCHKWLCAPKGSAFLYARQDCQNLIEPLVVSWGWGKVPPFDAGTPFLSAMQWPGTMDPSAFLSVPAAIRFQSEHDWPRLRRECHDLLATAVERIDDLTSLPSLYPLTSGKDADRPYVQMASVRLPALLDLQVFKNRLYEEFHIEVPCFEWNGLNLMRISVQAYNTQQDIDALIMALNTLLHEVQREST